MQILLAHREAPIPSLCEARPGRARRAGRRVFSGWWPRSPRTGSSRWPRWSPSWRILPTRRRAGHPGAPTSRVGGSGGGVDHQRHAVRGEPFVSDQAAGDAGGRGAAAGTSYARRRRPLLAASRRADPGRDRSLRFPYARHGRHLNPAGRAAPKAKPKFRQVSADILLRLMIPVPAKRFQTPRTVCHGAKPAGKRNLIIAASFVGAWIVILACWCEGKGIRDAQLFRSNCGIGDQRDEREFRPHIQFANPQSLIPTPSGPFALAFNGKDNYVAIPTLRPTTPGRCASRPTCDGLARINRAWAHRRHRLRHQWFGQLPDRHCANDGGIRRVGKVRERESNIPGSPAACRFACGIWKHVAYVLGAARAPRSSLTAARWAACPACRPATFPAFSVRRYTGALLGSHPTSPIRRPIGVSTASLARCGSRNRPVTRRASLPPIQFEPDADTLCFTVSTKAAAGARRRLRPRPFRHDRRRPMGGGELCRPVVGAPALESSEEPH